MFHDRPGKIIFLNGTSSSGKSTIAKELQGVLPEPYLHTGIDHYLERFPRSLFVYSDGVQPTSAEGWLLVFQNSHFVRSEIGPAGLQALAAMYAAIAALSLAGIPTIVDDVIYDKRVLEAAVRVLSPLPVVSVGVRLPIALAEEREFERGDRALGGARFFGERVHEDMLYDLDVDSANYSAHDCAVQVKQWVDSHPSGGAFQKMREQFKLEARNIDFP